MIKALEENKFVDILVGKFEESDVADEINSLDFNDAYEEVFNWVVENYQDGDNQFWSDTATNLMDEFYENGNEERKINESYEHSNRSLVKNYMEKHLILESSLLMTLH